MSARPSTTTPPTDRALRLLALLNRYSIDLTAAAGTVPSVEAPGNHELLALVELFRDQPISSHDLAERSGLSRRDTNRLLQHLYRHDLVVRTPSDYDRRILLIELTRSGRRQRTRFLRSMAEHFERTRDLAADIVAAFTDDPSMLSSCELQTPLRATESVARCGVAISDAFVDERSGPMRRVAFALFLIADADGIRPSALAEELGYTSGGMAHVLDDLEFGGYIERRYGVLPDDRRASIVTVTDVGRARVDSAGAAVLAAAPVVAPVFAALASESYRVG